MEAYGFGTNVISWVGSFLSNKSQQVIINGTKSEEADVMSGIPQGSVLGPLLFVIFINDMPDDIRSELYLFADDTKIFNEISDEACKELLQESISDLFEWSQLWLLKFHPDKCRILSIGNRAREANKYTMGEKNLKVSEEGEKDLGILIDERLNFHDHISAKIKKANQIVGLIRRSFTYLDKEMMRQLITSLIRPHLEYGSCIWKPHTKNEMERIEAVQKRATKLIPELRELEYTDRLKHLNLPCLAFRRLRGDMIETYKIINDAYDKEVTEGIITMEEERAEGARPRRHQHKIKRQDYNTNRGKFKFSYRIRGIWNNLPEKVVNSENLNQFKNRLDGYWGKTEMYTNLDRVYTYEHSPVATHQVDLTL
jgi:hypothetical protein